MKYKGFLFICKVFLCNFANEIWNKDTKKIFITQYLKRVKSTKKQKENEKDNWKFNAG